MYCIVFKLGSYLMLWHALSLFESQFLHPPGFDYSDFLLSGANCSAGHTQSDWSKGWLIGRAFGTIAIEVGGSPELLRKCLIGWDENSLADISNSFKWPVLVTWWRTIFTMLLSHDFVQSPRSAVCHDLGDHTEFRSVCMLMCDQSLAWSEQLDAAQIRKVMEGHEMYWSKLSSAFQHKILEKVNSSWLSYSAISQDMASVRLVFHNLDKTTRQHAPAIIVGFAYSVSLTSCHASSTFSQNRWSMVTLCY